MVLVSENKSSYDYTNIIYPSVFFVVILYFAVLKYCFGTFRLRTAVKDYKENSKFKSDYLAMFTTRDNLLYHISWSKSRGDFEQAKLLTAELAKLDEVLCYEFLVWHS